MYKEFLQRLAAFQVKHPIAVLALIAFLTLGMLAGAQRVRTVASLEQMMPKDIEEIQAFNTLRDVGLGQDIIAIVLSVDDPEGLQDVRDYEVYTYLRELSGELETYTDVLGVYSYAGVLGDVDERTFNHMIQDERMQPYLSEYINHDKSITILMIRTDVSADDDRMNALAHKIKEEVSSLGHPQGMEIGYTGTPIVQQKLGDLIAHDRSNTQWISTLLVFFIVFLIFGSISSAFIPIVVVTLSVNWLYGTMGYVGLPISTLAGGVAAMVIGIGIDFAIHIMNKFKYERKKGTSVEGSLELAVADTGIALTVTTLTTVAAFLAFLSGRMPEMGRFGLLMSIGILFSLGFSLFGLPAMLILEERFKGDPFDR